MNKILKARLNDIVNNQILHIVEQTYSSVTSLAGTEPSVEVWADGPHTITRSILVVNDERVLVIFRIMRHILFGFESKVLERGLIFSPDGHIREATNNELVLGEK